MVHYQRKDQDYDERVAIVPPCTSSEVTPITTMHKLSNTIVMGEKDAFYIFSVTLDICINSYVGTDQQVGNRYTSNGYMYK